MTKSIHPIRKGDFVLIGTRSWVSVANAPGYETETWELARASSCTRDGEVKAYRKPQWWDDGQDHRIERWSEVVRVGKGYVDALIAATAGATDYFAFCWDSQAAAQDAIAAMVKGVQ